MNDADQLSRLMDTLKFRASDISRAVGFQESHIKSMLAGKTAVVPGLMVILRWCLMPGIDLDKAVRIYLGSMRMKNNYYRNGFVNFSKQQRILASKNLLNNVCDS